MCNHHMRSVFILLFATLLAPIREPASAQQLSPVELSERFAVPLLQLELVATLPHSTAAYTQGLLLGADGMLYESTGLTGRSSLRRLDPVTGEIVLQRELPVLYFGEGIAWLGETCYQLTWKAGIVLRWNSLLEPLEELHCDTPGWGLTTIDDCLVQSDGTGKLFFRDATDFSCLHMLEVTLGGNSVQGLNELEYVQGQILANVYGEDFLLRISPQDGVVTGIIDASPLRHLVPPQGVEQVLNGIAWDNERQLLYLTGKQWPLLFVTRLLEN